MRALCAVSSSPLLLSSSHRLATSPLLAIRACNNLCSAVTPRGFPKLERVGALQRRGFLRLGLGVVAMATAADAPAAVTAPVEVFVKAAVGHPDKLGDCK